ncbi:MAG TPA: aspartate/glutamate racemase family protein [Methylomirabilota bacterium]|nr:aspartate/glutamate racemase family protein [Methylomirabilota bacterium]
MSQSLACIHTSMVFINVETMMNDIFKEVMPNVRRINIVDDSLLADVMAAGKITQPVTKRMCAYVQAAEASGADAILSLCSSLGPTIDIARPLVNIPVIKIDDPMAEEAVRSAKRIGVMATVLTTLGPTVDLIRSKATAMKKELQIEPALVEGAFQILMSGDRERHDRMVAEAAQRLATKVDIIVLAQASMTRLVPSLAQKTGLRILSSPRLAIERTAKVLDSLPKH